MQQIIISGVGGQGVLYITRLLAEAALFQDRHILISETHGMAQRGGNVISHLKVGKQEPSAAADTGCNRTRPGLEPTSPLIRPGRADFVLALHSDGLKAHGYFLKSDGTAFCNAQDDKDRDCVDATGIAASLDSPVSANLVLLGFALASGELFCTCEEVESVLKQSDGKRLEINLKALRAGLKEALEKPGR